VIKKTRRRIAFRTAVPFRKEQLIRKHAFAVNDSILEYNLPSVLLFEK